MSTSAQRWAYRQDQRRRRGQRHTFVQTSNGCIYEFVPPPTGWEPRYARKCVIEVLREIKYHCGDANIKTWIDYPTEVTA